MAAAKLKGSGLAWYVRRGSAVRGPFSSTKVRHFVLEEKLGLDDEVSEDQREWHRLGSVPEVVPPELRADSISLTDAGADARLDDRRKALRAMLVVAVVVLALTVAVSWLGRSNAVVARDCAAPAAPGVLLEGCRLAGADLTTAPLRQARLANAVLTGARLVEADLSQADMRYTDLERADLSYARLHGAVLIGANLRSADLTNADLQGADLSFADLAGARLGGSDLGAARLDGAIWTDGRPCSAGNCPR